MRNTVPDQLEDVKQAIRDNRRKATVYRDFIADYLPPVRGIARILVVPYGGSAEDAEDLAQEVFRVIHKKLPGFDWQHHGAFRTWLRQVIHYEFQTWLKSRGRWPSAGDGSANDSPEHRQDPAPDFTRLCDDKLDLHEYIAKAKARAKKKFSSRAWRAFELTCLEGRSAGEVAALIGWKAGQVYTAKSIILRWLQQTARQSIGKSGNP